MKSLIKLLFIIPAFVMFNCGGGDDSDNAPTNTPGSFLVEYDGVIWGDVENSVGEAFWISVSPSGSIAWDYYDGECDTYINQWGEENEEGFTHTVEVNTANTLVVDVACTSEDNDCEDEDFFTTTLTVSSNGNALTVTYSDEDYQENYVRDDNGGC